MIVQENNYNNESNEAIEFAIHYHNILMMYELSFPYNCVLRARDLQFPTEIIFDISADDTEVNAILCISDGQYSNNGIRQRTNTLFYISCILNNYNGDFIVIETNNINDVLDILRFLRQVVEDNRNDVYDLDYVRIPENMLNWWFISNDLRELNINN